MKRGVNILDKRIVYDGSGASVSLARLLKAGGEGEIFYIDSTPGYCAKIFYEKRVNTTLFQKITAMVTNPPDAGLIDCREKHGSVVLAWPVSLLFDSPLGSRNFIGYTMPLVDTDLFREAHCYYDPQDRIREFGGAFSWRYLLTAAYNIATVTDDIHQHGHCVADFSARNILIARTAAVAVIDCDSFQIRDSLSGRVFPSVVGTGEYLPPEHIGQNFAEEHPDRYYGDLFGLAVMVFKLLMGGVHPFQAGGEGVSAFPGIEQKIQNGVFAFASPDQKIYPPSFAPDYRIVPPSIRRLFSQCFVDGIAVPNCRPTAAEWKKCLLSEVMAMKHCKVNVNHWYGGHLVACPWCSRGKQDIFPAEIPFPPRKVSAGVKTNSPEDDGLHSSVLPSSPPVPGDAYDAVKSRMPEPDAAVVDTSSIAPDMNPLVSDDLGTEVPSIAPDLNPPVPDELGAVAPSITPDQQPSVADDLAGDSLPITPDQNPSVADDLAGGSLLITPDQKLSAADDLAGDSLLITPDQKPSAADDLAGESFLITPDQQPSVADDLAGESFLITPDQKPSVADELAAEASSIAPGILIPEPHMTMHNVARGITIPCFLPVIVTGNCPLLIHLTSDVPWIEIADAAVPVEGEGGVHVTLNTGTMSNKGFQNGRVILSAGDIREEIFLFVSVLPEF